MVYNPPVIKEGGDADDPVTVTIEPVRMGDAYVEQAKRAAGWITLLLLGWLIQRLFCDFGLPPHCDLPRDALEVLTDLLTLLVFGLAQAWFCEILEERRFRELKKELYFVVVFFGIILIVSAVETSRWWEELRFDENGDWKESHIVIVALFMIALVLIVAWHFAEAWRILPGAYYVSGNINVNVVIKENLHRIYNVSRGLIVTYALLYGAFAVESSGGLQQHYVLLAWVLSLLAQFKSRPSVIFLALCSGVFIQGLGAYRLRFICDSMGNHGNGFGVPGSGFGRDSRYSSDSSDSSDSYENIIRDDDFSMDDD